LPALVADQAAGESSKARAKGREALPKGWEPRAGACADPGNAFGRQKAQECVWGRKGPEAALTAADPGGARQGAFLEAWRPCQDPMRVSAGGMPLRPRPRFYGMSGPAGFKMSGAWQRKACKGNLERAPWRGRRGGGRRGRGRAWGMPVRACSGQGGRGIQWKAPPGLQCRAGR
jgi:hypothetical protein